MIALPDKLSDLVELALNDLTQVQAQPDKYIINMNTWVSSGTRKAPRCQVCLAGAVMVRSLDVQADIDSDVILTLTPTDIRPPDMSAEEISILRSKLMALDHVRRGDISVALDYMGLKTPDTLASYMAVPPFGIGPNKWFRRMHEIIAELRLHNL